MFDPKKFVTVKPKPFPVFLLLDVSGSMDIVIDPENTRRTGKTAFIDGQEVEFVEGGTTKTQVLNDAVKKMIDSFKEEEKMETEFLISVITFGDDACVHLKPTKASDVEWTNMSASGETALGAALNLAKKQIEDKEVVPSRAYRPTIVLVSDGQPNDNWERPLKEFISEGRSSKCDRMAMAIGHDADEVILKRFIEGTPHDLFYAENAGQLHEFFQRVTMSVTMRTQSKNPNVVPAPSEIMLEGGSIKSATAGNAAASSDDDGYW